MDLDQDIAALAAAVTPAGIRDALAYIRRLCRLECPLVTRFCNERCNIGRIKALLQRKQKELKEQNMDFADRGRAAADIHLQAALKNMAARLPAAAGATHCDNCDDPIPAARRKAVPGCRLCVACQAEQEKA